MSDNFDSGDVAAGFAEPHEYTVWEDIQGYLFGLVLAVLLTAASFYVVYTHLIWAPAIPIALVVLAVAQIGVLWFSSCTSPRGRTIPTTCWRWLSAF